MMTPFGSNRLVKLFLFEGQPCECKLHRKSGLKILSDLKNKKETKGVPGAHLTRRVEL
jgi:hypothetical protein